MHKSEKYKENHDAVVDEHQLANSSEHVVCGLLGAPMLAGRNILVVEDELLIAFDLEDTLTETGATASLAHDVGHALATISRVDISAAIVDCNLNDQSVEPVLDALVKKNIPFVLHSGSPSMDKFSRWPARDVISKPASPERIKRALLRAVTT